MQKRSIIRIIIVLFITYIICFSDCSFADATTATSLDSSIGSIGWRSEFIVSVCQLLWIPIAKITGYFLTNELVYGGSIGLDSLLWTYWNLVKNIANFCLGFFFIYTIFSNLIKGSIEKNIKNSLLRVLIAGIGIQASRFLTAAVIDISTITITAIGSLPSQLISSNEKLTESIKKGLSSTFSTGDNNSLEGFQGKILDLFPKDGKANSFLSVESTDISGINSRQNLFDAIMINKDGSAGPLYFLGLSILDTTTVNSLNTSSKEKLESSIINIIIGGGSAAIYCIELCVLCIICILRIIYLRMFIVLSPIAILLVCIGKSGQKLGDKGFIANLGKQIKLSSFFLNAFQPTIIVFGISLAVMVSSLMKGLLIDNSNKSLNVDGITFSETITNGQYDTNIDSKFLSVSISKISKSLAEIILSFLTLFIIYFIIDAAIRFKKGSDFVSNKIGGIQDFAKNIIQSIPVVPVVGYTKEGIPTKKHISLGKTLGTENKDSIAKEFINTKFTKPIESKIDKQIDEIRSGPHNLSLSDKSSIDSAYRNVSGSYNKLTEMRNAIKPIEGGKGMILDPEAADKYRQNKFTERLNNSSSNSLTSYKTSGKNRYGIVKRREDNASNNRSLEGLFQNSDFVKTYANFFDLGDNIIDRNTLKHADISNKH